MEVPRILTDHAYSAYESKIDREVRAGVIPNHLAFIMDGNRRYAEEVLKDDPMEGHRLGREKLSYLYKPMPHELQRAYLRYYR